MSPLRLDQWLPMYREICAEFGYDPGADTASAQLLWSLLSRRPVPSTEELRARCPRSVTLFGDGPSLAGDLEEGPFEGYIVAADGATTTLLSAGIVPDAVVTDLDGAIGDLLRASAEGAIMFVHAHGDNTGAVRSAAPRFEGTVVGTCQCPPVGRLLNMGGFTDGDRAACIFSGLGAAKVVLKGFDLTTPSEKAGRDPAVKMRKLAWARRILGHLSSEGVEIEGLDDPRVTP